MAGLLAEFVCSVAGMSRCPWYVDLERRLWNKRECSRALPRGRSRGRPEGILAQKARRNMIYGKIRENYRKHMGNIWEKWVHNGPFEAISGHSEHREWVRSLNFIQLKPSKTPRASQRVFNWFFILKVLGRLRKGNISMTAGAWVRHRACIVSSFVAVLALVRMS